MTISGAISHIDAVKPNTFNQNEKRRWLSVLDGIIKAEIIDTHEGAESTEFQEYAEPASLDQELLVPHPYDDVYIKWLEAQIDYALGEYGKYNNSISLFNAAFLAYEKYYNRTHKPIAKKFTHF